MMNIYRPNDVNHRPYTGFSNMYLMDANMVTNFLKEISTQTVLDDIKLLFENPLDSVVSIRCFPFNITQSGVVSPPNENVIVGRIQLSEISAPKVRQNIAPIDYTIDIVPKYYNSFLDYEPYTSVQLYLPYIGYVNLEPRKVMGNKLKVSYVVDLFTGNATAYVQVRETLTETYNVIMICEGKISIDIPITARNAAETVRNMLMTGLGIGAGQLTAKVGAVASAAMSQGATAPLGAVSVITNEISSSVSMISAMREHITKGAQGDGYNAWYAPQSPHLIITRTRAKYPDNYAHYYGKPSGKTSRLRDLEGFTRVSSVHVENVATATQDELTEIERLLKTGVIL